MRNLQIRNHTAFRLPVNVPISASTWDTTTDSIICAAGPIAPEQVISLIRISDDRSQKNSYSPIASWDAPSPHPGLEIDKIVNLQYVVQNEIICLVLAGGDIIVVREQCLPGQDRIEIVGSVDAGISAAAWSPDGELLAVVTTANTLLFMTAEFENVSTISFALDDDRLSKHVSVGWGKSETQFKGKRAKALRDPTMPEKTDEGTLSIHDAKEVTMSWRGDGAYVAVNSIEDGVRRMIRVCSRDGTLDSVTEPVNGLEGALSWRPAGNLLAGIRQLEETMEVVFFERNGLRHGQFILQGKTNKLQQNHHSPRLFWNIDSTILAISLETKIQFYTMANYHYYLKQEIHLQNNSSRPVDIVWHPEDPFRFNFVCRSNSGYDGDSTMAGLLPNLSQEVRDISFGSALSIGTVMPPEDFGASAVVDGCTLKLTAFRIANVPPPMALHDVNANKTIKDVTINRSNSIVAALHEDYITLLDYDMKSRSSAPSIGREIQIPNSGELVSRQISFKDDKDLYVLLTDLNDNTDKIFDAQHSKMIHLYETQKVQRMFSSTDSKSLFISCRQNAHGQTSIIRLDGLTKTTDVTSPDQQLLATIPAVCTSVEVGKCGNDDVAFGLTRSGALYANEKILARDCTSFLVTENHLVFTTSKHLLKFVHLTSSSNLEVPEDIPEVDERCRSIERGAKLVVCMPSTFAVILQMPRGNLETIYPRALVLAGVRQSIASKDYKAAFLACRKQRVDLNIIYDHAPSQLLENIELFLDQVKKTEYIDLFLSQLVEDDVSQTMYKNTISPVVNEQSSGVNSPGRENTHFTSHQIRTSKVNKICDSFIAVLEKRVSSNLQNLITANVCKNPPDISAGLSIIAAIRSKQPTLLDTAIEHICFLVDINHVYDNALGIYDLDLALLVAQQSQKDPREYLPYIQNLEEMNELRRKFTIDEDLGRRAKALHHLHALKAYEEALAYTDKYELYHEALRVSRYESELRRQFLQRYACFLESSNRFKEAAIAFESLSDFKSAMHAYKAAHLWQQCLSCAQSITLPEEELVALAQSLSNTLLESKHYKEAATIQLDYVGDVTSAIRNFCRGHEFAEAIRLSYKLNQAELITTIIDPSLIEAAAVLAELLADCKSQLGSQIPRLAELRKMKAQDPLAFFDGMENPDIPDNVSLAPSSTSTTGGTLFTRYTNQTGTINTSTTRKTSKNRRREERKRARGKKGSVYEEEYLINSIARLIERVNDVGSDITETVETLLRRNEHERARALDMAMTEVVTACQDSLNDVFGVDEEAKAPTSEEQQRPQGADGVLWDSMTGDRRKREPPKVKEYTRSSLIT